MSPLPSRRGFLKLSLAGGALLGKEVAFGSLRAAASSDVPPEIPVASFEARVAAIQQELGKRELAALVITSTEGYDTRYVADHAPGVVLVPASGNPTLFAAGKPRTWIQDVRQERDLEAMLTQCGELLAVLGARRARIAIAGDLAWAVKAKLATSLPEAQFVPGDEIQDKLRLIKDAHEIAFMRKAQEVSDAQLLAGQSAIRPGRTDRQVLAEMVRAAVLHGVDLDRSRHLIGYGPGTDDLWSPLTGRRIASGEVLNFEGILYYGPYVIETPVTFAVGKVSPKQKDLASVNFEALQAGLGAIKAGVALATVVNASNAVLKRHGFDKMIRRHGHFSGLANNDRPSFDAAIKAGLQLEPGMTMSYHTTITLPSKEAIVVAGREVLVTTTGHEIFSRLPLTPMMAAG